MGIVLTDYVVESVIRDGLKDLRDRPALLDDLFSQLLESYLTKDYGEKALNLIKDYVKQEKIYVFQSYNLTNGKFPCYTINLQTANESEREAFLQDFAGESEVMFDPIVRVGPFTAFVYDSVTGSVTVPDAVDTSLILVNDQLLDFSENVYPIRGGIITTPGNKQFNIGRNLVTPPDLSGPVSVIEGIASQIQVNQAIQIREQILIGVYAQNDPNICKWLYYLLMYFLHQRKQDLEMRGIQLSNITASDFRREEAFEGEHLFARYVTMSSLTCFGWKQPVLEDIIGTIVPDVRVPKDVVVVDDPTRTVNTEL